MYKDLKELDLVLSHAEKVGDLTACPGNDTCNLGIASSKGLGEELSYQLENQLNGYKDLNLKIKMSGCPNSCGQHHIADIGFWGGSLKVDGKVAPAFQVMLGGYTKGEILETAKPVIKLPARAIPRALEEVLKFTRDNKKESESFNEFVSRVGLKAFKEFLRPFAKAKPEDFDRFYSDFGVKEDFYVRSGMKGECAGVEGDLVSSILEKSRSFLDTAKENLDDEDYSSASYLAFTSIVQAAKGVALNNDLNLNTYNKILENFAESIDQAENWRNDLAEFRSQLEIFKGQIPNKIGTENYLNFALKAFYCAKDLISKTQTSVEERI